MTEEVPPKTTKRYLTSQKIKSKGRKLRAFLVGNQPAALSSLRESRAQECRTPDSEQLEKRSLANLYLQNRLAPPHLHEAVVVPDCNCCVSIPTDEMLTAVRTQGTGRRLVRVTSGAVWVVGGGDAATAAGGEVRAFTLQVKGAFSQCLEKPTCLCWGCGCCCLRCWHRGCLKLCPEPLGVQRRLVASGLIILPKRLFSSRPFTQLAR